VKVKLPQKHSLRHVSCVLTAHYKTYTVVEVKRDINYYLQSFWADSKAESRQS